MIFLFSQDEILIERSLFRHYFVVHTESFKILTRARMYEIIWKKIGIAIRSLNRFVQSDFFDKDDEN